MGCSGVLGFGVAFWGLGGFAGLGFLAFWGFVVWVQRNPQPSANFRVQSCRGLIGFITNLRACAWLHFEAYNEGCRGRPKP